MQHGPRVGNVGAVLLSLALLSSGCGSTELTRDQRAPSYLHAADNHRSFGSADELAAYLRHGSDAGPLISAHRGGASRGFPENCIETMQRNLQAAPALFEIDIRLSSDSVLVLMHDETLDRTTSGSGPVAATSFAEIRKLLLRDEYGVLTPFRVPSLAEALAWSEGRAVLTLDVKDGVSPEMIVDAIRRQEAEDRVVVIAYDLADLMAYRRIAPGLNYSATAETLEAAEQLTASVDDVSRLIVWTGLDTLNDSIIAHLHGHGIRAIVGAFEEIDRRGREAGSEVYEPLLQRGVDIIATDRVHSVAEAIGRWKAVNP